MRWIAEALEHQRHHHRLRTPTTLEPLTATTASLDGRTTNVFCSNDYLGLRLHPQLAAAATQAQQSHGTGTGASRLVSGSVTLHERAEARLARLVRRPSALLSSSGYATNLGTIASLAGPDDVVFSDELNHASIIDGCRLSRARIAVYPHRDTSALEALVQRHKPYRRGWLLTESLFSMDGTLAPLTELSELCQRHDLHLHVDEAHALGVIGDEGEGLASLSGVVPDVLVGTLGKALGSAGAFVAGTPELRLYLWNHCRSFVFSTAVSPATAAVAAEAAQLVRDARTERRRLAENIAQLREGLERAGHPSASDPRSPIVPLVLGDDRKALALSHALLERGHFVQAIRPPTVPEGTARLRITLSAAHTPQQIDSLLESLTELLR